MLQGNSQSWKKSKHLHAVLFRIHPNLFDLQNPVPFKIGFADDFLALYPELPAFSFRMMMRWLTVRRAYLTACKAGAARYGVDGKMAGVVSEKDAAYAAAKFDERENNSRAREARRPAT